MSDEANFGGILEETEDCPVKTIVESIDLNLESPVSIVITKFSNQTQLIITETGKTSVFYQVSQIGQAAKLTYETNCLFGQETEESLVTARIIGEQLGSKNPIIVAFGLGDNQKSLNPTNISTLVGFIKSIV